MNIERSLKSVRRGPALLAAAGCLGMAVPVWASESAVIEEVVVTAQKREQSLADVPISINVVAGDTLDSYSIVTFEDLDEHVPNLLVTDSPGNNQIYIRGIGTESGSLALEQSVSLFVDGIYAGRARQFQEPFLDVERVEVLRGPQGALVGKNTSAGAISIVSRLPTNETEVRVDGEYEFEHDGYSTTAILSGPLSDAFRARLVTKYEEVGGYVRNTVKDRDEPDGDRLLMRGTGVVDVTEAVTATVRLEYAESDIDGHPFVTIPLGGDYDWQRAADAEEYDEQDTLNASITVDAPLGGHTLTSITGYVDLDSENFVDADFTAAPLVGASFYDDLQQFSQEFRLLSPTGGQLDYVLGVYYLDRDVDIYRETFWNLGPFTGTSNRDYRERSELYSVYGQVEYGLSETVSAVASARYTDEDKEADLVRFNDGLAPPSQLDTPISGALSEDEVDLSAKLQWQATDYAMLYLSYAEGSKGGGFAGASASVLADNFEFGPETSQSWEAGAKLDLSDGRGFVSAALFTTTYEDLQLASYNGVAFDFANAAEAESRGVEIDSAWTLGEGWQLNGSVAYLDTEYEDYPNGACLAPDNVIPGCVEDLSGTSLPHAPQWTGRVDVQYSRAVGGGRWFTADAGVSFRDDFFTHPAQFAESRQDAFAKLDLRLELADERQGWTVALVGRNLTDETTITQSFETPASAPPGTTPDYNLASGYVDVGRTIALQFGYSLR
ncbi:MAG: TonB-dependent receptor [Pseudomonadota bacterium]